MSEARLKKGTWWGIIIYWIFFGLIFWVIWRFYNWAGVFLPSLVVGHLLYPDQELKFAEMAKIASLVHTFPVFLITWVRVSKSNNDFLKYIGGSFIGGILGSIVLVISNLFIYYIDIVSAITYVLIPFSLVSAISTLLWARLYNHRKWKARHGELK